MNKIIKISILLFLSSIAFNACSDEDYPFGPVLEASMATVNFGTEASAQYISVNTNRTFTVSVSASWCTTEIIPDELENLKISVERNGEVGKQRTAEILVSSDGMEDRKVTVVQEGVTPIILVTEKTVNMETGSEFSLEIEANLLFEYGLPDWIHAAAGNVPAIGKATYHFVLDPLPNGETFRSGNIIVRAADAEINKVVTIPVSQGTNTAAEEGANKTTPYTVEAESSLEGLESKWQDWWASSGDALGANRYINAYSQSVTYPVKVIDAGNYDFSIIQVSWGGGSLKLYIDDVEVGSATIPGYSAGGPDIIAINNISLTQGEHVVKAAFTGNSDFDKITVAHH
jgi:hypothetical protein